MMYSGDELYGEDCTSPLYRPTYQPTRTPRRMLVKQARKAIARATPSTVYEEYADLYEDDPICYSNDAEDRYNRGGW